MWKLEVHVERYIYIYIYIYILQSFLRSDGLRFPYRGFGRFRRDFWGFLGFFRAGADFLGPLNLLFSPFLGFFEIGDFCQNRPK